MLISTPLMVKDRLGSSAARFAGSPPLRPGSAISVSCANSSRPIICSASRVFSVADVTDAAWKLPPYSISPRHVSTSGLSLVELSSVDTCASASSRSSSCGPSHCGAVRSE